MALSPGAHTFANATFATTTSTASVTSQATGSTFFVAVQCNRAGDPITVVSVTDNKANTYVPRSGASDDPGFGGDILLSGFECINGTGGSGHIITVTLSEQATTNLWFIEVLGADTTSPDAGQNATSGGAGPGTTATGPSITTITNDVIVLSVLATYGFNTSTVTITDDSANGWAILDSNLTGAVSRHGASSYVIKATTGTYNDTYTMSASDGYSIITVAYKAAGSGTGVSITGQSMTFTQGQVGVTNTTPVPRSPASSIGQFFPTILGRTGLPGFFAPGLFEPLKPGTMLNTGIVSVVGQSLSLTQGTFTPAGTANVTLSGQALTLAQGTMTPVGNANVTLTGQSLSFAQGTLGISAGSTIPITGQALSLVQGSMSSSATGSATITGQTLHLTQGTMTVASSSSVTLSGITMTIAQGVLTGTGGVPIYGPQNCIVGFMATNVGSLMVH